MKGDIMSKRIYHLTIEFDPETEEIEYIVETLDETQGDIVKLTKVGNVDLAEYFDEEDILEILSAYEVGEA
tara:strand:+ start:57 stop:269 length:213 start_codon:yes stop_codon:yes gene_type:complete